MTHLKRSVFCSVLIALMAALASAAAPKKPNIIFILADDYGARDLSNEGSTFYETPNLDRLSRMGVKFTRGYAACQVCSPSRASILTGKYPVNHGITDWIGEISGPAWHETGRNDSHFPAPYAHNLRASEITLPEALAQAGYQTFFAGKWHLGSKGSWPTDHGFQINKGGWDAGSPKGGYFAPYNNPNLTDGPNGESLPIRLARETASFIDSAKDKPFLAYLSFYSVHGPIQTSPDRWAKYQKKAVAQGLPKQRFIFDRRLGVRQVQDCPIYAGMIEAMDDAVGLVLDKLQQCDLMDKSIICFTSDNGGVSSGDAFSTSNLPFRGGKGRQWEGGIREPFYISVPGLTKPGTLCDVPVHGIDWYPTLLQLAGVPVPPQQAVDGVSLVPLLKGQSIPDRPLFWHYPHYGNQGGDPSSIIIRGDWKLIYYHEDQHCELYNIAADIGEQHDLVESCPQQAQTLKNELMAWLKATHAKFPQPDPQFDPAKRDQRFQRARTVGIQRLEQQHARYVDKDFKPNKDWWGSVTTKD